MAKSRFEYVKKFELHDELMPNTWIVVRIDGKAFHRFSDTHSFEKPNDLKALQLMNACADAVMCEFPDIVLAYGESDEYSFVFGKATEVYNRRSSKLISHVASTFTSHYVFHWRDYFPDKPLRYPPTFDARAVCYPTDLNMKDYLSWRQADCHINNLYNTCFWLLVHSGMTTQQSEAFIRESAATSAQKNELLFSKFQTNYDKLPAIYRKGSVLVRKQLLIKDQKKREKKEKRARMDPGVAVSLPSSSVVEDDTPGDMVMDNTNDISVDADTNTTVTLTAAVVMHLDIIGPKFWKDFPFLLD